MLSIIGRCPGREPALLPREGTNTGLEKAMDIERSFHFGNLHWFKIFRALLSLRALSVCSQAIGISS